MTNKCLVIAEGYATAASIHVASGLSVAIAFDAGNLLKVAQTFRKKYPKLPIMIAADADITGIKKAKQAAHSVGAKLCIPDFSGCDLSQWGEKVPSDFNDLHQLKGVEAVAEQINNLLTQPSSTPPSLVSIEASPPPQGYVVNDNGVYWVDPNGEEEKTVYRVGARLDVLAFARNKDGREWGLMLHFNNFDGEACECFIPQRLFGSDRPAQVLELLLDRGYELDPHRKSKQRLLECLQKWKPARRVRLTNRFGWHGDAYLSPLGLIGTPAEELHYYSERKLLNRAAQSGTLEGWQEAIATKCVGNPLMLFAVSIPFTAPLLQWLGYRTIGFHIMGASSLGKSTLSMAAGSVCGGIDYIRTWNTTAAALEPTASEHSDGVLILDEINQADPLTIGQTVYQLGNEEGRARATDTGSSTRTQHKWRLVWLSNGEKSLKEIQNRVGKSTEAGMEMRLLHIRADLHHTQQERDKKGIFQELHGFVHGADLSEYLKQAIPCNHGHASTVFIQKLTEQKGVHRTKLIEYLRRQVNKFQQQHLSEHASGQARRAAMAFALVGECGELASKPNHTGQSITGWPKGEARKAAALLFKHFLADRGGEGNAEDRAILEQICLELQTKGESHFTRWDKKEPSVDTHQPRSMTRWGFRKVEDQHEFGKESFSEETYFIYREVFRKEVCKGFSYLRACELLQERGALITNKGKGFLFQKVLPGTGKKQTQIYCVKMSALQEVTSEQIDDRPLVS